MWSGCCAPRTAFRPSGLRRAEGTCAAGPPTDYRAMVRFTRAPSCDASSNPRPNLMYREFPARALLAASSYRPSYAGTPRGAIHRLSCDADCDITPSEDGQIPRSTAIDADACCLQVTQPSDLHRSRSLPVDPPVHDYDPWGRANAAGRRAICEGTITVAAPRRAFARPTGRDIMNRKIDQEAAKAMNPTAGDLQAGTSHR